MSSSSLGDYLGRALERILLDQLRALCHDLDNSLETIEQSHFLASRAVADQSELDAARKWLEALGQVAREARRTLRDMRSLLRVESERADMANRRDFDRFGGLFSISEVVSMCLSLRPDLKAKGIFITERYDKEVTVRGPTADFAVAVDGLISFIVQSFVYDREELPRGDAREIAISVLSNSSSRTPLDCEFRWKTRKIAFRSREIAIAHHVVKSFGGKLSVSSDPDAGNTIILSLPRAPLKT